MVEDSGEELLFEDVVTDVVMKGRHFLGDESEKFLSIRKGTQGWIRKQLLSLGSLLGERPWKSPYQIDDRRTATNQ